jgi:hypothetical protein
MAPPSSGRRRCWGRRQAHRPVGVEVFACYSSVTAQGRLPWDPRRRCSPVRPRDLCDLTRMWCTRERPAKSPGLRDRRHDPSQERPAVFRGRVLGYSTKRMMTKTTAMTSAAMAMVRVSMAVSVYLIAPGASPRIWRLGELERAGRSEPPGGAVDGHGPAELRAAGHVPGAGLRARRTLARFPGLAHL